MRVEPLPVRIFLGPQVRLQLEQRADLPEPGEDFGAVDGPDRYPFRGSAVSRQAGSPEPVMASEGLMGQEW